MSVGVLFLIWAVGIGLIATELFVPNMISGSIGALAAFISICLMFAYHGPLYGGGLTLASLVTGGVVVLVAAKRMAHRHSLSSKDGFVGTDDQTDLIGKTGVTATVLRPAGFANIGGKRIDVVTSGEMLQGGTPIEVISVEGNEIFVRKKAD